MDQKMKKAPLRILAIAPLPPPIGGWTSLMRDLTQSIASREATDLTIIKSKPVKHSYALFAPQLVGQIINIFIQARRADVITLHSTFTGLLIRGPSVYIASRLNRIPYIVHTSGGILYREAKGPLRARILDYILSKAYIYLAETQSQVRHARNNGVTTATWFPNCRKIFSTPYGGVQTERNCRKFVFMSHIKRAKGIFEIIDAVKKLKMDIEVDVFGPFFEELNAEIFENNPQIRYKGVISPENAIKTLEEYDALLLPTYYKGEGYPGAIIEAYMAGLPVISTKWRSIPEIVDETTGILVKPKDSDSLSEAIRKLVENPALFNKLRAGVIERRNQFDLDIWTDWLITVCRKAANK
jgi:glycosyltransferase involved in cell wall biosynthesis